MLTAGTKSWGSFSIQGQQNYNLGVELGVRVGQKFLTLVVPMFPGSEESIRKFGFAVRLLCVEETGLLLDPTEHTQVVWKGLSQPGYCPHQHPVLFCE